MKQSRFKSRKALRKEERKAKKQRRHEYYAKRGKQKVEKISNDNGKKFNSRKIPCREERFRNLREERDHELKQEENQRKVLDEEIRKKRIERLMEDNEEEEKEIKKLEKQLKFRKGKRSSAFALDGLDFLLDICDRKIARSEANNTFEESDTEFEDDLAIVTGKKKKLIEKTKHKNTESENVSGESVSESEFTSEEEESPTSSSNKKKIRNVTDVDHSSSGAASSRPFKKTKKEKHVKFLDVDDFEDDEDDSSNEIVDSFSDEFIEESEQPQKRKMEKKGKENAKSAKDNKFMKEVKDKKSPEKKKKLSDDTNVKKLGSVGPECRISQDISDDELSERSDEIEERTVKKSEIWEDIYGRTRDKEGNIIKAYKPPHLRIVLESGNKNQEKLTRLKRQLKGLLNRLAENNMASISSQIEELYMSHSRNDMNETLKELITEAIVMNVSTPERLVAEHAMLIAILHANVGSEVGAFFLQYAVTQFYKMINNGSVTVEDKSVNNLLLFIMQLYNFQIFQSKLIYDLMHELLQNLEEKKIELLLLILRTVGFSLRKDDPAALKSVVLKIQQLANSQANDNENYSRMKYMLDVVSAVKNNNVSKIPNYNPEFTEHLKKCMKVLIRKGNYKTELNISLQDLLNAEEQGKWWVVGSAWSGSGPGENTSKHSQNNETNVDKVSFSRKLLDLAKKQRMNTDVRRTVFCTLMSAEDYLDAFERLMKLGLKGAVEREIIYVLLHCSLQEKDFNPFYYHLANKLCIFDRKYQIMIQYAVWDKIKELNNMLPIQITNLAKFLGNIIINKGLPLSVLKVIQFSELDKVGVKFVRQVLLTIVLTDEETVSLVFSRIVHSAKLKIFRDGIRLFLHHFLIKHIKSNPDENSNHLLKMIDVADKVLTSSDLRTIF